MHEKSTFVFWTTLILYLITLFTVSYVGVYLTYIAIPIIVISGLIMKLTSPREKNLENSYISIDTERIDDSNNMSELSDNTKLIAENSQNPPPEEEGFLKKVSNSLTLYTVKKEILNSHSREHKNIYYKLSSKKNLIESLIKYENKTCEELLNTLLSKADAKIQLTESHINSIENEIELEIEKILSYNERSEVVFERIKNINLSTLILESGEYIKKGSNLLIKAIDNTINELKKRTEQLKEQRHKIELLGIEPSVFIKNETDIDKIKSYQEKIDQVNSYISLIDKKIHHIANNLKLEFLTIIEKNLTSNSKGQTNSEIDLHSVHSDNLL